MTPRSSWSQRQFPGRLQKGISSLLVLAVLLGSTTAVMSAQTVGGTWSEFSPLDEPVFEGDYIASDPTMIDEGDFLRMFYTCWIVPEGPFDPATIRAALCQATSADGLTWTPVASDGPTPGLTLRGIEGSWEEHLEAAFAMKIEETYLLYYSGYRTTGDPALGFPAALSVATSTDGIHFERISSEPILSPSPGWYDNDAIYSPAIVVYDEQLLMVYAGHCYTDCTVGYGNTLLGATSSDGFSWTKLNDPILSGNLTGAEWTKDGVAEPALLWGPDGMWYLFITGLEGESRSIGIANSESPLGPWLVSADPILEAAPEGFSAGGVLAPFVLLDGSSVRVWYLGTANDDYAIGYATAEWPLRLET